jgi:predicted ATPase
MERAMLTRLKVNGFKNLVDVDVRFGPFTCIAGVNGSGKSNLFDAIRFLAALAEKSLVDAALSVRGGSRSADIRDLFHRVGDEYADEMSFEVDMIVPSKGVDDLNQPFEVGNTLLRYGLTLQYRQSLDALPIRIRHETLDVIDSSAVGQNPQFPHGDPWRRSAIHGAGQGDRRLIAIHNGIWSGMGTSRESNIPSAMVTTLFPRTALASVAAGGDSSVTLARQEMRSWRVLQFNPAAMREPDSLIAQTQIGSDGAHLAAALYSVAHTPSDNERDPDAVEAAVYARTRNRLFGLIGEMREITVDRDDKREELTLYATGKDGTRLPARALSDGTLRFLALTVLEQQEEPGLYCVEEPENGVHPGRIEALLKLLQAIAMDTNFPIESGNPLRQVIISTHSPSVVMRVPADSLVVAELRDTVRNGRHFNRAHFSGLTDTWRDPELTQGRLALWQLLEYLNPEGYRPLPSPDSEADSDAEPRVMDHVDVRRIMNPRRLA